MEWEGQGTERVWFSNCCQSMTHTLTLPWPSHPQMSADYDHLSLLQKVEVFEHTLESTLGDDLAKVLWLKSPNSEVYRWGRWTHTHVMTCSMRLHDVR